VEVEVTCVLSKIVLGIMTSSSSGERTWGQVGKVKVEVGFWRTRGEESIR